MALYALDDDSNLVSALGANPLRRFRCLECRGLVHKRAGPHKRPHFRHLSPAPQCRLHSQSIDHLVLQARLKEAIPELELEKPFPSILRIADLCWERQKIIFEIQCSPLSLAEAALRRKDYAKESYSLVWLLDERLFNRKRLRIAEDILRKEAGYFISLRKGIAYDQFEVVCEEERLFKGPPLPVDLSKPLALPHTLPPLLQLKERTGCFRGDLLARTLQNEPWLQKLLECESSLLEKRVKPWHWWLSQGFQMGLEYLLRKTVESNF